MTLTDRIRRLTGAVVGDVTDEEVQAALDENRVRHERLPIEWEYVVDSSNEQVYTRARVQGAWGSFEPGDQADAHFTIVDSLGDEPTGNFTLDSDGTLVFATDQTLGPIFYVSAYTYDVSSAAAEVIQQLIGLWSTRYTVKLGDQTFNRSDAVAQLKALKRELLQAALPRVATLVRTDQVANGERRRGRRRSFPC